MKDNFGLGGLGLNYLEPSGSRPIHQKESFQEKEERRIRFQQLKNVEKYYKEHPNAILPSGDYGGKSHRDENGNIVMERTIRRR